MFTLKYKVMPLIDHVRGQVNFQFYRKGQLFYKTDSGLEFTVPVDDCGDGVFLTTDKAVLFMRYIRKQLEANAAGLAAQ